MSHVVMDICVILVLASPLLQLNLYTVLKCTNLEPTKLNWLKYVDTLTESDADRK